MPVRTPEHTVSTVINNGKTSMLRTKAARSNISVQTPFSSQQRNTTVCAQIDRRSICHAQYCCWYQNGVACQDSQFILHLHSLPKTPATSTTAVVLLLLLLAVLTARTAINAPMAHQSMHQWLIVLNDLQLWQGNQTCRHDSTCTRHIQIS